MHLADVATGNLGANGIVGGGLPIAVGAALAIKKQKRDDVAMCFFGDGASNEGAFHEALNMAAIWKLPVVFVCENNKYGMSVSTERSMAVANVADRAVAYGMPSRGRAAARARAWSNARPTAPAATPAPTATATAARRRSRSGRHVTPFRISQPNSWLTASPPKRK